MAKDNGIETISEKPIDQMSYKEVCAILLKRIIALPSKIVGFKGLVFIVSIWLLIGDHIENWTFLSILVLVLFGKEGLKMIGAIKK